MLHKGRIMGLGSGIEGRAEATDLGNGHFENWGDFVVVTDHNHHTQGRIQKSIIGWVTKVVMGSVAWLGRGLSCVCAHGRRDSDTQSSFDLTPAQDIIAEAVRQRCWTTKKP